MLLVLVSFVVKSTAGDDPGLKSTVTAMVKVILYTEVGVGILTVLCVLALTGLYLWSRIVHS